MITGELKSKIDHVWEAFWTGDVANPLTVIEQITYLIFIRRLDERQLLEEKKANMLNMPLKSPLWDASFNNTCVCWFYFWNWNSY
ncbi:MAG: type I restriction enzyme M protein [Saprospiraceae bacterium]|jgi:type I restriction enzyme M protein